MVLKVTLLLTNRNGGWEITPAPYDLYEYLFRKRAPKGSPDVHWSE